jgi:putative Holliday junction resolvase
MSRDRGLLLAFDYGLKRIGVATGNRLTRTATPLTTLQARSGVPWAAIDALVAEWQPDLIVVGDPGPDANARLLEALAAFRRTLAERYALAVEPVDERFSSAAAESMLRAGRAKGIYNRRLKKDRIDRQAACLIAEQWMSEALERD